MVIPAWTLSESQVGQGPSEVSLPRARKHRAAAERLIGDMDELFARRGQLGRPNKEKKEKKRQRPPFPPGLGWVE